MQQINQPLVSNLSGRGETVQDKHRNAFDVAILYPSFTISNLEISRENGDGEHIQLQITIQIWGCNVKKWAHYIILNADLAPKDRSTSLSSDGGRIWKRRAVVAVERLKRCYILQPLETCRHSNLLPPHHHHLCVCLCPSLFLSLSHSHFDFALGPFSLSALLLHFSSHPLCVFIQCIYPCSCLSGCTCICMCVCASLCLIEFATLRPLPPLLHPCLFWLPDCTCLVLEVRFSPCICVRL